MPKGLGFKKTGNGPRYGNFSFSSKAGFSGSTGRRQEVRTYSRSVPKRPKQKFAHGGMVVAKMADSGSSVVRRTHPVTQFDAEHGGKGPLKPGFADGGKVQTTGAAIKLMKELMKRGESADSAAAKAARRHGVSKGSISASKAPTGGGGLPAEKQMLARGGLSGAMRKVASEVAGRAMQAQGRAAPARVAAAPVKSTGFRNAGPIKQAAAGALQSLQGRAAPRMIEARAAPQPVKQNHGYGTFRRGALFGAR